MLYTSCILTDSSPEKGTRISVMSRHTLSDGITPDARIVPGVSYSEHLVDLSPPPKLVGAYYRQEIDFAQYEKQYEAYLSSATILPLVQALVNRALTQNVVLLCIEESPRECHRRLLAEFCFRQSAGALALCVE